MHLRVDLSRKSGGIAGFSVWDGILGRNTRAHWLKQERRLGGDELDRKFD